MLHLFVIERDAVARCAFMFDLSVSNGRNHAGNLGPGRGGDLQTRREVSPPVSRLRGEAAETPGIVARGSWPANPLRTQWPSRKPPPVRRRSSPGLPPDQRPPPRRSATG